MRSLPSGKFLDATTTTIFVVCQYGRKPEKATAHQSWLLAVTSFA